ncbi:PK beta-barrel-protein domain-containing protein-like protein [Xylariaceae sp. FL0804]|nr:PK beta-barrel-protein domain-containing protein-like protein [Xylariaceae sp. FL0804]
MAPASDIDLFAPFERDTIVEVRTSKMKTMTGLRVESGIDKLPRDGRIPVSKLGLDADEHDLVFHGGPDKAIHGYCSTHYPKWREEFPEAASRFQPGGFGENFVTERMNERNVCIGDVVAVGDDDDDGLLLQVSLPRQPCFKLNQRFRLRNFAPNAYRLSRTGWYYRVLREGTVQAGDEIRLVERRWPRWTIERVQEYLHRTLDDAAMNEELSHIADMGDESRKTFEARVAKHEAKQRRAAGGGAGGKDEEAETWTPYRIVEKKRQTARITSFVLEAVAAGDQEEEKKKTEQKEEEEEEEESELGAHVRLQLPNGLVRAYSIVTGGPLPARRLELGVAREPRSRGGSAWLHDEARAGKSVVRVGRVTEDAQPAEMASRHVFVVGGVGITAYLSMLELYRKINWHATLHYGVRDAGDVPFRARVEALGDSVKLYDKSRGERMDIPEIFRTLGWNAHVYVCGPRSMMEEARREAKACGLSEDDVHFEAFSADGTGDPFEVEVANKGGKTVSVGADETLLEALRRHFDDVPSSCEVGNCGTCRVGLRAGRVEHRGTALMEDEKREAMLSCVSRGVGKIAIEI